MNERNTMKSFVVIVRKDCDNFFKLSAKKKNNNKQTKEQNKTKNKQTKLVTEQLSGNPREKAPEKAEILLITFLQY